MCFAQCKYRDIKGTNLQTEYITNIKKYQLLDKNTKKIVSGIGKYYKKFKKINYNGETVIFGERDDSRGDYYFLYSLKNSFSDFLLKYYELNNQNQNIIFKNYPKLGKLKYKTSEKREKNTGYINVFGDYIDIILPTYYSDYAENDDNSIISRLLGVSYNINGYEWDLPAIIDEEVKVNDGKLIVTYNDIKIQPEVNWYSKYGYRLPEKYFQQAELFTFEYLNYYYTYLCNLFSLCLENYPLNALVQKQQSRNDFSGYDLYIYEKGKIVKTIKNKYKHFYFADSNSFINKSRGINISFISVQDIIAQDFKNKYGIIDKDDNVLVPFIYDAIYPIGGNTQEKFDTFKNGKLYIKYSKQKPTDLFIVKKDGKYGVINNKNEIIVPIEFVNYSNSYLDENLDMKKLILKKCKQMKRIDIRNSILTAIFIIMFILCAGV